MYIVTVSFRDTQKSYQLIINAASGKQAIMSARKIMPPRRLQWARFVARKIK